MAITLAKGGIDLHYTYPYQYTLIHYIANVMVILVPATFDMQVSQDSSRDSPIN
jgi:hypothetical protein